jgi:predicted alpha/beta-fold hydrolase
LNTKNGRIVIDWENRQHAKNEVVVIILPGMNGSSHANYITHFVNEARKLDCISLVVNIGIEIALFSANVNSGSSYDDLDSVVNHVKSKYPTHLLFAVGVSYGTQSNAINLFDIFKLTNCLCLRWYETWRLSCKTF